MSNSKSLIQHNFSALISISLAIFVFLSLANFAKADYYNQGVLKSTNVLSGATVSAISGFRVTSSMGATASTSVQFSQDRVNFYNSSGTQWAWDSCSDGTTIVDLSGLGWTGGILYYKFKLETTDALTTPTVTNIQVDYTGTDVPADSGVRYPLEGILLSTNVLSGAEVSAINSFSATSSIPAGASVSVQFSQDGVNFYSSAGAQGEWDSCSDGATEIDLSGLGWSGALFYKLKLETIDNEQTPVITEVQIDYDGTAIPPPSGNSYPTEGTLTSANLLSGVNLNFFNGTEKFGYNITFLPSGTAVYAQFSQDGANWYSSAGALWAWDTLSSGNHLNVSSALDLSGLGWSGDSLYYKLKFTTVDPTQTAIVSEINLLRSATQPNSPYTNNNNWYDANWKYKKAITLESDQIETTESEFPVLVSTILADLKTTANGGHVGNDNGYDIIFVDDDNSTLLNFEQEKYVASTGEIVYWVNTDISSTTDKVIYMYYGNASAKDLSNAEEVWDDNFVMVQHLQETPAGTTYDSTSNNNDGTTSGMDSADQVAGQIDGALNFDGGANVDCGSDGSLDNLPAFTASFWVNNASLTYGTQIVSKGTANAIPTAGSWGIWVNSASSKRYGVMKELFGADAVNSYDGVATTNQWDNLVFSWNGETDNTDGADIQFYINSVLQTPSGSAGGGTIRTDAAESLKILTSSGLTDEVRISNIVRTAGWIETEYNNQSDAGSLMDIGAEQTSNWYNANWKYKKAITLESDQIETTESEFPVLVSTTLADLKSYAYDGHVGNDNGYDIIFVDDDNSTLLNFEQETYDPSTGEIVYWVNTDISSTTDKIIYMYYGNASATDLSNAEGVWGDAGAVGVWHMSEGSGDTIYDSSGNNNNGTLMNGAQWVSEGVRTEDATERYIDMGNKSTFDFGTGAFSIVVKINNSTDSTNYKGIVAKAINSNNGYVLEGSSGKIRSYVNGVWAVGTAIIDDGNPHILVMTREGTSCIGYVDGEQDLIDTVTSGSTSQTGRELTFGGWDAEGAYGWLGFDTDIEFVRLYNTAISADWIATEYNNLDNMEAFLTIGAEEGLNRTAIVNAPITNYLTDGLVGYWTFNGPDMDWASTTAEALDMSGQGNHGDVIGATAAIGKVGQGLDFDGDNDYVDISSDATLDPAVWTFSGWIKPTFLNYQHVYGRSGDYNRRLLLSGSGDNFYLLSQFSDVSYNSGQNYEYGEWHHIIHIVNFTGDSEQFYVNGNPIVANSGNNVLDLQGDVADLRIGLTPGNLYDFNGLIDEVRIYNRALSPDEIGQLYRIGARKMRIDSE